MTSPTTLNIMTSPTTLNTIQTLPVDLWNIIIYYSDYSSICGFILMCELHELFDKVDLDWLKYKCIYDNTVGCSVLNRYIYSLYNKISSINNRSKYIIAYSDIYNILEYNHLEYSTILLKYKLSKKIEDTENKNKFLNITNKIFKKYSNKDSNSYIVKMIECI